MIDAALHQTAGIVIATHKDRRAHVCRDERVRLLLATGAVHRLLHGAGRN